MVLVENILDLSSISVLSPISSFFLEFQALSVAGVCSLFTVPVQLEEELNSGKSHTGVSKILHITSSVIENDTPFSLSGPETIQRQTFDKSG
jgi:hypothetical protein